MKSALIGKLFLGQAETLTMKEYVLGNNRS
jgi:hypothetical protein